MSFKYGAVLLLAMLALAPSARPDDAASVVVLLNDGRRLEGTLVSEDEKGIVLHLKVGADVPIGKAEIKEIVRPGNGPAKGAPGDEGSSAEEETVVTLKDGGVVRGRLVDHGDTVEVENEVGTVRIERSAIRSTRTEKIERTRERAPVAERDEVRDVGLGFEVTRPGPSWRFGVARPDPLARVTMRREDPLVLFRVGVGEPLVPELRDVGPATAQKMREAIQRGLRERFRGFRGLEVEPSSYKGTAAWRVSYTADARVFGSKFNFVEIHLTRGDGHLVLEAKTPIDDDKRTRAEMEAALDSFSWLGAVTDAGGEYLSYPLGIRIPRPRPEWRLHARLFDPAVPLALLPPDGAGSYTLRVSAAGAAPTPRAAADALEAELGRMPAYRRIARSEKNLSGTPVVDLHYAIGGEAGGGKGLDVRRLIMIGGTRRVEVVAETPADVDRREAMAALFDGIDALVEESAAAVYRQSERAVDLRVAGERKLEEGHDVQGAIKALAQAIDLAPSYGLAFLLRGKAYFDSGDFKHAMKDYGAAEGLIEDPALSRLVAAAENEQAKRLMKEGDIAGAQKLFRAAIRNDPQSHAYRDDLFAATTVASRSLAHEGRTDQAVELLKEVARLFPGDERFPRELARIHVDAARKLEEAKELYKARGELRRALKLDPQNDAAKGLLERIEQEIKKKEEPPPAKGKGR